MGNEAGEWIMHGVRDDDRTCVHNFDELLDLIDEAGFLPLFQNGIKGFSVEEHANPDFWWSGNEERDPWEWRMQAARSHRVAYGKFFCGKAGFISLDWLPVFANFRRNGYDFDALWDDGKAQNRQKKIMDCFSDDRELFSFRIKQRAGFGKDGEKNFEGVMTSLQQSLYLVMSDFRCRRNRYDEEYGWSVALFSRPEDIWGYEAVTASYNENPRESYEKIALKIRKRYTSAQDRQIQTLIGKPDGGL